MEQILTAVVLGIVAGVLMKALFLKDSHIGWDVALGAIGGLVAYYIATASTNVADYVATIGTAVVVAGVLNLIRTGFGRTA